MCTCLLCNSRTSCLLVYIAGCDPHAPLWRPLPCAQSHFGPWFATFHTALLLEFENSLLAIAPEAKALPYWEMYEDLRGGNCSITCAAHHPTVPSMQQLSSHQHSRLALLTCQLVPTAHFLSP